MNRKAQVYLLVAIVLCFAVYALVTVYNTATQENTESEFEKFTKNYETESRRFLDDILATNPTSEDVLDKFTKFTAFFTSYAKSKATRFQLLYAFVYDSQLYFGNYLETSINLVELNQEVSGCYAQLPASVTFQGMDMLIDTAIMGDLTGCSKSYTFLGSTLTLQIEGFSYSFDINQNQPELVIVTKEVLEGGNIKVFIGGKLVEGVPV